MLSLETLASFCLFSRYKCIFKKRRNETCLGEVEQIRLYSVEYIEIGVKTVPDSAVAGVEVPQQVEAEPVGRCQPDQHHCSSK